jgi:hypothetical protein
MPVYTRRGKKRREGEVADVPGKSDPLAPAKRLAPQVSRAYAPFLNLNLTHRIF